MKKQETVQVQGAMTMTSYDIADDTARALERKAHTSEGYTRAVAYLDARAKRERKTACNLVTATGLSALAGALVSETPSALGITKIALGTGTRAVSASDNGLQSEVHREGYSQRSVNGSTASVNFFIVSSVAANTYEEASLIINDTIFFNRLLTGGWVKTVGQAMTISATINFRAT